MDNKINLEIPIEKTNITRYVSFKIKDVVIKLNSTAIFVILLYGEDENTILCKTITMEGDDYTNWGIDDSYVIEFIKTKLKDD
jgi:hypothetical protein